VIHLAVEQQRQRVEDGIQHARQYQLVLVRGAAQEQLAVRTAAVGDHLSVSQQHVCVVAELVVLRFLHGRGSCVARVAGRGDLCTFVCVCV